MTTDIAGGGGTDASGTLRLADYVRTLYRRKWAIIAGILIGVAAAAGYSYSQPRLYEAHSTVVYDPQSLSALLNLNPGLANSTTDQMASQAELIESPAVSGIVAQKLGFADPVNVSTTSGDELGIAIKDRSPTRAAEQANAYASAYVVAAQEQVQSLFVTTVTKLDTEIANLQGQVEKLTPEIAAATAKYGVNSTQVALLSQEESNFNSAISSYEQESTALRVDESVESGGASIGSKASAPHFPVQPRPKRDIPIGAAIGLILGVAGAFVLEALDDAVASQSDLERLSAPLPTLAAIPTVRDWKNPNSTRLASLEQPDGSAAEAYRSLRTAVRFIQQDSSLRVIQVTSPGPGEGKTTTAANLGVVLAKTGLKVLLIDCDLRRPRLHLFLNIKNEVGLASELMGEVSLEKTAMQVEGVPGLWIVPSGTPVANPSEWLGSEHMADLIRRVREQFDVVVIDSAPVLPVTDAVVLSGLVDATIVVTTAGSTSRKAVRRSLAAFRQVNGKIAGLVLNRVGDQPLYGYSYEEYYRYVAGGDVARRGRKRHRRHRRQPVDASTVDYPTARPDVQPPREEQAGPVTAVVVPENDPARENGNRAGATLRSRRV